MKKPLVSKTPGPEPSAPDGDDELDGLLDEKFPPVPDIEYEPALASHDPLDDDDVPECPPPDEEIVDEDDPISGVTSGFDVTARIACDAASILPQEHVQEMFQDAFNQGGSV